MPYGKGTYGKKVGRPPKKRTKPKMVSGQPVDEAQAKLVEQKKAIARANRQKKNRPKGTISSSTKRITLDSVQREREMKDKVRRAKARWRNRTSNI